MCKVLNMNRSTFYKCIHHVPSKREVENQKLDADILAIYYDTNCRYGTPKICDDLHDRGWHVSLKRVQRRMAAMGDSFYRHQEIPSCLKQCPCR